MIERKKIFYFMSITSEDVWFTFELFEILLWYWSPLGNLMNILLLRMQRTIILSLFGITYFLRIANVFRTSYAYLPTRCTVWPKSTWFSKNRETNTLTKNVARTNWILTITPTIIHRLFLIMIFITASRKYWNTCFFSNIVIRYAIFLVPFFYLLQIQTQTYFKKKTQNDNFIDFLNIIISSGYSKQINNDWQKNIIKNS